MNQSLEGSSRTPCCFLSMPSPEELDYKAAYAHRLRACLRVSAGVCVHLCFAEWDGGVEDEEMRHGVIMSVPGSQREVS